MVDAAFRDFYLFLLIFMRFTGAFFFNPLFGRRSVPANIKAGLAFLCALLVTGALPGGETAIDGWLIFALLGAKELLVGFVTGFVLNLLFSVAVVAGEMIDLQLGVGMARIYDPQSNATMPLSGTLLNLMLTLLFFLANGHLTLIKLVALSFRALPPAQMLPGVDFAMYLAALFGQVLVMGLKLALPVLAVELLAEFGLGALMRSAPQLNIFSVGLQLRLILGFAAVLTLIPLFARALDGFSSYILDRLGYVIQLMA